MHDQPHSPPSSLVRQGVRVLAIGLCLVAAIAIWALIAGSFDDTGARVLFTSLAASLCTLGGLAGATALPLARKRRVGEMTIGLSLVTLLLAGALIWLPDATEADALMRAFGATSVLALAGAHASLLLSRSSVLDTRPVRRLGQAAIVCATSAALLLSGVFAVADGPIASGFWRFLGVLVVLALLNTLLVPVARRLARGGRPPNGNRAEGSARPCV